MSRSRKILRGAALVVLIVLKPILGLVRLVSFVAILLGIGMAYFGGWLAGAMIGGAGLVVAIVTFTADGLLGTVDPDFSLPDPTDVFDV